MSARVVWVRAAAVALLGLVAAAPLFLPGRVVQGEKEPAAAPPFTCTVLFDDAGGLKAGHPVTYHGVPIGEVVRVDLTADDRVRVTLHLDAAHKARVHADATARVVQDGLVSVTGERALEVVNGADGAPALAAGSELAGVDSWTGLQLWRARRGGSEWAGAAQRQAASWVDWFRGAGKGR